MTTRDRPVSHYVLRRGVVISALAAILLVLPTCQQSAGASGRIDYSKIAKDFLERLPTEWSFYVIVGALMAVLAISHRLRSMSLVADIHQLEQTKDTELSERDWWVVRELRKRALGLRFRADWILVGVVGLLFGGLYVVAFVLSDLRQAQFQQVSEQAFRSRFGQQLDGLSTGRYWVEMGGALERTDLTLSGERGSSTTQTDSQELSGSVRIPMRFDRPVAMMELTPAGESGIIASSAGLVAFTTDSGESWRRPKLGRLPIERVTLAAFSAGGERGLLAGDEDAAFFTNDGGARWDRRPTPGRVTALAVSPSGEVALIADRSGSVFVNRADEGTWRLLDLVLSPTEWITQAAFSQDGRRGLLAGDEGSVFSTSDGGLSWANLQSPEVTLGMVTALAVSTGGELALVAGTSGSVLVSQDDEEAWTPLELDLSPTEWITRAALSNDGERCLLAGDEGSVFFTSDGGVSWENPYPQAVTPTLVTTLAVSSGGELALVANAGGSVLLRSAERAAWVPLGREEGLDLSPAEWISRVAISQDGERALLAGTEGSVYFTRDRGASWTSPYPRSPAEGRVTALALSPGGGLALVANQRGSVFLRRADTEDWVPIALDLSPTEWITWVVLGEQDGTSLVGGDEGTVFLTRDGGQAWTVPQLEFAAHDWATLKDLSADRQTVVMSGDYDGIAEDERLVFSTRSGGSDWTSTALDLSTNEGVAAVALSADGRTGFLAGNGGSFFRSLDGTETWSRQDVGLSPGERINAIALSLDGETGLVGGRDFVLLTTDRGERWVRTEGLDGVVAVLSAHALDGGHVAETNDGRFFLLKNFGNSLQGWDQLSYGAVVDVLAQQDHLRESRLLNSIRGFATDYANTLDMLVASAGNEDEGILADLFSDVQMMQLATLTVLFLLVGILVRLHQYNLRLAAFWESRCDAVLLARSFAKGDDKVEFDSLVRSLAPDLYDFKTAPEPVPRLPSRRSRT